jgi:hypothetical protein
LELTAAEQTALVEFGKAKQLSERLKFVIVLF